MVRHALPERKQVDHGSADPGLAVDGHGQAEHLAEYLATESIDAINETSHLRNTGLPMGLFQNG